MTKMLRFAVFLATVGSLVPLPRSWAQEAGVVVYLVRHAEKLDDSRDPPLNAAGQARAAALAVMLKDAGVTHVWSTDFLRTRHTAEPAAAMAGLEVASYDPRDLAAFATRLWMIPGRHLVVGHSNTTPQLVTALGGQAGSAIEESEYDRLYVVTTSPNGTQTILLRFGASPEP